MNEKAPRFITQQLEGGPVVVDERNGLMWTAKTLNEEAVTQQQCDELAKACTIGGHTDWRLPTIQEQLTLVDYERSNPAIDKDVFSDTESDWYWTSTPWAGSPADCAWGVGFDDGLSDYGRRDYDGFCRAVRSVPVAGQ